MAYTDAASTARDKGLQAGLDDGMAAARSIALAYGRLQGFVCSFLIQITKQPDTAAAVVDKLQAV